MGFYKIFFSLLLLISFSLPVYSDTHNTQNSADYKWILATPLAVSTTAIESPNGVHCYIGIAYETNGMRRAAVAMSRHCLNLVAIAALVHAEATDGDSEKIRLAINNVKSSSDAFYNFSHIYIDGIEYDLN